MSTGVVDEGLLIFAITFAFQFADRSSFGVITLATRFPPLDVWLGAAGGFFVATSISMAIGLAAISLLAPYLLWVKVAGGAILVAFGARELLRTTESRLAAAELRAERTASRHRIRLAAFTLIFVLELGGNTQILAILFVASTQNVLLVLIAAWLALVTVTAIELRTATYLMVHVPVEKIERALGAVLVVVGAIAIFLAFEPRAIPFAF
jgi:Ca2+/H+ antiporter, TMEM165/GDT1 family